MVLFLIVIAIENQPDHKNPSQTKEGKADHPFEIKNKPRIVETTPNNQQIATKNEKETTAFVSAKTFDEKKNKNNARLYFAKNHSPLKQATASTSIQTDTFSTSKNTTEESHSSEKSQIKRR